MINNDKFNPIQGSPAQMSQDASGKWIFCGGMIRSGSTLQYQIASELIERLNLGQRTTWHNPSEHASVLNGKPLKGWSTFKTHLLTEPVKVLCENYGALSIYVYRDLRDVLSSFIQKNAAHLSGEKLKYWIASLLETDAAWRGLPSVYISKYENVIESIVDEVRNISNYLGLECPDGMAEDIAGSLSYEAQSNRLKSVLDDFVYQNTTNVFDKTSLLHKNHLQSGAVGRYVNSLTEEQLAIVEKVAGGWLLEMGYGPLSVS